MTESLTDSGFNLPTTEASSAKETATLLHQWLSMESTQETVKQYDQFLIHFFDMWTSVPPRDSAVREQIWQRFACFSCSDLYIQFWTSLYETAGLEESSSVLSFYITYTYFIRFWQHKFPAKQHQHNTNQVPGLTFDEQSALWYVAGQVKKNITKQQG